MMSAWKKKYEWNNTLNGIIEFEIKEYGILKVYWMENDIEYEKISV